MHALARRRNGKCLSDVYVSNQDALTWQCAEGHIWKARPAQIKQGSWCSTCFYERRRLGIEAMHAVARERGGRCLSDVYVNISHKLRWQCKEGHEWDAVPTAINQGEWCPVCAINKRRLTMADMQRLARRHGGRCISKTYVNCAENLTWQCKEGHTWKAQYNYLRSTGHWCPQCRIEKEQRERLEWMQAVAKSRGGECLATECRNNASKAGWRCAKGHVWQATPDTVGRVGCWCSRCHNEGLKLTLEEIQAAAARKGGKCLSTEYINSQTRMRWQCEKGHVWETTANKIQLGGWCPTCSFDRKRGTIERMQALAHERGGRCVSTEYINSNTKLEWECRLGHRWMTTPTCIVSGQAWCPQCAILERCKHKHKRRKYLPDGAPPAP